VENTAIQLNIANGCSKLNEGPRWVHVTEPILRDGLRDTEVIFQCAASSKVYAQLLRVTELLLRDGLHAAELVDHCFISPVYK
ncbi:hypothetical protein HAX54_029839, partial [Datura stramonium]|nr:hypothetical protein [Datura stramonium]